jgi:hypothetical protein
MHALAFAQHVPALLARVSGVWGVLMFSQYVLCCAAHFGKGWIQTRPLRYRNCWVCSLKVDIAGAPMLSRVSASVSVFVVGWHR